MLVRSFVRGLLLVVPLGVTAWVLWWAFTFLDRLGPLLGFDVPGLGVAILVVAITAVGFFAGNILTGWIVRVIERAVDRVPIAKLIYGSIRDLLEAFVGEKKRFDRPATVSLGEGAEVVGFVTSEDLGWLGREGRVAVYFPQSYNFAGNMALFDRARVTPLEADAAAVMQFIVSGGVSGGAAPDRVKGRTPPSGG